MTPLPVECLATITRIEAQVDEAERLGTFGHQELAYALRETLRRDLLDRVNAYLTIPENHRDATSQKMLLEQLLLLERSTRERLSVIATTGRTNQAANEEFTNERFGS